jgi:hypothetical protein
MWVCWEFSLVSGPGTGKLSLQALRGWLPSLVRTLHRYYARVRLLTSVPVGHAALAFSHRSAAGLRRVARGLRVSAPVRMVFAVCYRVDTLDLFFHSSIPGLPVPLSTLRLQPLDWRCTTRGQDGSLLLSCNSLILDIMPVYPGAQQSQKEGSATLLLGDVGFSVFNDPAGGPAGRLRPSAQVPSYPMYSTTEAGIRRTDWRRAFVFSGLMGHGMA